MIDEALAKFRRVAAGQFGADASVAVMRTGATAAIDSATAQQAVIGLRARQGGLMANLSLEGTRVTPLDI
jgi:lipid-binding SYLF domain-containing protein